MSKKFKVPWVISTDRLNNDEDFNAAYRAADKHRKQLCKAEESLADARDFCETLRGHLIEEEAYTEVTVVEHIEKLIRKARNRLERHERWYSNLFVAYFDLKAAGRAK